MTTVIFRPIPMPDGTYLDEPEWQVLVDGKEITTCRSDMMDFSDMAMQPLWEKLGINIEFDDDVELGSYRGD